MRLSLSANAALLRLSRWPRRIAALVCLLLAAATAFAPADAADSPRRSAAAARKNPLTSALRPGQVAVPLAVTSASMSLVQVGDRVGVLIPADPTGSSSTAPALAGDQLRVLAIRTSGTDPPIGADSAAAVVVVAADRDVAVRLAHPDGAPSVLILDESP